MVMVVSTTDDGDPPDTVVKFWRRLKRKTNPPDMLQTLRYQEPWAPDDMLC